MGRPELDDVTSSRLKMRPDIEEEIDKVIIRCGFRHVTLDELLNDEKCPGDIDKKRNAHTTSWNRTLHLYERVVD